MSGFCTECSYEIDSFDGLTQCPNCGTTNIPCHSADQVNININWHELRILTIWAENYARSVKTDDTLVGTVFAIARRVENQHPDRAMDSPLTFAGELRQLADKYPFAVGGPGSERLREDIKNFKRINDITDEESI